MQSRGRNLPSVLPGEETFRALQSQRGALSSTAAEGEIEFEVSVSKKSFQIKIKIIPVHFHDVEGNVMEKL